MLSCKMCKLARTAESNLAIKRGCDGMMGRWSASDMWFGGGKCSEVETTSQLSSDVPCLLRRGVDRDWHRHIAGVPTKDATLMVLSRNHDGNTSEIIITIKRSIARSINVSKIALYAFEAPLDTFSR